MVPWRAFWLKGPVVHFIDYFGNVRALFHDDVPVVLLYTYWVRVKASKGSMINLSSVEGPSNHRHTIHAPHNFY